MCRAAISSHASSSSVYGANSAMPFRVLQNVDHPLSLYGASKKANELMAHAYAHLFALPATGLRFFTVYGPWGRPDMATPSSRAGPSSCSIAAIRGGTSPMSTMSPPPSSS
jgi:nucleoside-diphosphate-sugar epimerase